MNKQDNENINTSLLQGEVSPQAVVLPTGIIKPTGGITGIIPPTGITPTGIRPTGILPTDNLLKMIIFNLLFLEAAQYFKKKRKKIKEDIFMYILLNEPLLMVL